MSLLRWFRGIKRARQAIRLIRRANERYELRDWPAAIALAQEALTLVDPPFAGPPTTLIGLQGAVHISGTQVLASAAARAGDRALASRAIREWLALVSELERSPRGYKDEAAMRWKRWANDYLAWNGRSS